MEELSRLFTKECGAFVIMHITNGVSCKKMKKGSPKGLKPSAKMRNVLLEFLKEDGVSLKWEYVWMDQMLLTR
jgi:hypothetical protein